MEIPVDENGHVKDCTANKIIANGSKSAVDGLVMPDGWHCDPQCQHLRPDSDPNNVLGRCAAMDVDLDWYDFYIAACVEA